MIHAIHPTTEERKPKQFVRMFQPRFEDLITAGLKPHTVRSRPCRMPEPGDVISCRVWLGKPYRSKQREFFRGRITKVEDFLLMEGEKCFRLRVGGDWLGATAAHEFALADGFSCMQDLAVWFAVTHGLPFEGIVTHWVPLMPGGES